MNSFQSGYELCQSISSDSDATNLTLFKKLYNIGLHKLEKKLGLYHQEENYEFTTLTDAISGSSNQDYMLPVGFNTLSDLYVTVGSNQYWADLVQDPERWRAMNSTTTSSTSDFLQKCFIRRDRIQLWPIPSSANTATMWYTKISKDLSATDYTTGTITTLADGGTTVTGDSTIWTAAMVGRYFQVDDDGDWHRIKSRASATSITLETEYEGSAITAGSSTYTIGEMPNTPPDTHELPCWYALWQYNRFRKNRVEAKEFKTDWKVGIAEAIVDWADQATSKVVSERGRTRGRIINPNYYPEGMA